MMEVLAECIQNPQICCPTLSPQVAHQHSGDEATVDVSEWGSVPVLRGE